MSESRLSPKVAAALRAAIALAGGREVCFVCSEDADGVLQTARVAARGGVTSVLALPGFAQRGEMLVHNHPSGALDPSDADLAVAARLHDDGIGFAIIDNNASRLYVVVEVPRYVEQTPLDLERVAFDLGPDGAVAQTHQRYEDRPSQREMAELIAQAYNDGGVALLEAGTGIGKSLGYLVPALRWAAANGERTVVSTNTINLQEQLVRKDLPFLARAITDQPVRFALLKGWRNYLCLARLEQARASGSSLFEDELHHELDAIAAWAKRTSDGSMSDLTARPSPEVWDEVSAEPDLCTRVQCPHFDNCFLFKARRAAAQADVIVANHHLLLADIAVRRASQNWDEAAVLPSYRRLVIDEGHHLEDAAAAHLGMSVTRGGLQRLFNRLERRGGRGLLPTLVARLRGNRDLLSEASLELIDARLAPSVRSARDKTSILFDVLDEVLAQSGQPVLRLTDEFAVHPVWKGGLRVSLENTLGELGVLDEGLSMVRERLEGSARTEEAGGPMLGEMRAVSRRLQSAGDALREALDPTPGAETVRWIEARGRDRAVAVASVPLDLAPILRDDLFSRLKTTIVTSATLAAEGRFDFMAGRLGLTSSELEPVTRILPSPFDYARQALLAIPTDTPAPNRDPERHAHALVRILLDVADAADGGVFVLFTSHREVRRAAELLRAKNVERRWPLLVHGEDGRDRLLTRFQESGRAVLLGTTSFWEGVDVPGDPLRALLLAKIPFRVPTEPLTAARCEAIGQRGGDPFAEYMVPDAALKLKQGFGRLIRTATDRGAVIIADSRVATARYGAELLRGLPPARRVMDVWEELRPVVREFYAAD
ncbi:MAG TPA: helicase C-terminal domain-containing protein [Gemmatimonadaceae bacterium]|nr:helicase C-terminal domain-containing protein [Gemmatimonadaceae bacterium]